MRRGNHHRRAVPTKRARAAFPTAQSATGDFGGGGSHDDAPPTGRLNFDFDFEIARSWLGTPLLRKSLPPVLQPMAACSSTCDFLSVFARATRATFLAVGVGLATPGVPLPVRGVNRDLHLAGSTDAQKHSSAVVAPATSPTPCWLAAKQRCQVQENRFRGSMRCAHRTQMLLATNIRLSVCDRQASDAAFGPRKKALITDLMHAWSKKLQLTFLLWPGPKNLRHPH